MHSCGILAVAYMYLLNCYGMYLCQSCTIDIYKYEMHLLYILKSGDGHQSQKWEQQDSPLRLYKKNSGLLPSSIPFSEMTCMQMRN